MDNVLDYNELKLPILQILSGLGWVDSNSIAEQFSSSKGISLEIHALRMALMRYHKQGLLKRERRGGVYSYALSERGYQRLRWLEQQAGL